MTDLSKITAENGTLKICFPGTNNSIGLTLDVLPPDSPEVNDLVRRLRNRAKILSQKGRPLMTEDDERNSLDLCRVAVVGWKWHNDFKKQPGQWKGDQPEFSPEVLDELLALPWLRRQVDDYLADEKNFFK